jgi:hypothetical protein
MPGRRTGEEAEAGVRREHRDSRTSAGANRWKDLASDSPSALTAARHVPLCPFRPLPGASRVREACP